MLKKNDIKIIKVLRRNSRESLTSISKITNIPISTLFEKLKKHGQSIIIKHTTLLDFAKLGYMCRVNIMLKTSREHRNKLGGYLKAHSAINNLYKINKGYDFLAEGVFSHVKELEDFLEELEQNFPLKDKKMHYLIEDIKREGFMS